MNGGVENVGRRLFALSGPAARPLALIGWLLLILWCLWWADNLVHGSMRFAEHSWIRIPAFGVDFTFHVDKPTRIWMAGGDPYADKERMFSFPPIVTRLFMWVRLTTPEISLRIWIILAAAFAAIGAIAAAQWRPKLGLTPINPALAASVILFSTPVLFELERGNYDLIVVPFIVGAAFAMRSRSERGDAIAGFCLAIAVWAKLYPGLLIFAVLALRRWRLAVWLVAWCALIGLADIPELLRFNVNNKLHIETAFGLSRMVSELHPWNHPLSADWTKLWAGTPLALIPSPVGAALFVASIFLWVSWHVFCCRQSENLALPYMFWVVAAGTFWPPVSNDYNLTPLPLALLAAWSARDRWPVQLVLVALLLWWQPLSLPIPGGPMMFLKMAGLIAAGAVVIRRAAEQSVSPAPPEKLTGA